VRGTRAQPPLNDRDDKLSSKNIQAIPAPAIEAQATRENIAQAVISEKKADPVVETKTAIIGSENDPKITLELPVTAELLAATPTQEKLPEAVVKPVIPQPISAAVSSVPAAFTAAAPVPASPATPASVPAAFSAPTPAAAPVTTVTAAFTAPPAPAAVVPVASIPPAFSAPAPAAALVPASSAPAPVTPAATVVTPVASVPVASVPPAFSVPAPAAFIAAKIDQELDAVKIETDAAPDNLEEGDQQKLI